MQVREARSLFPGLLGRVFLDSGAVGLMPESAVRAVKELIDFASGMQGPDTRSVYAEMGRRRREAVSSIAQLIGASPDEIALVESTTHGLNLAAASIPIRRGESVIVPDTEFPQVAVPWAKLAEERGTRVKFVKSRNGRFTAEDMEAEMDRRTRVVCLSSVQWSSGFRVDLGAIGKLCRSKGIYLVVDAIQHVGAAGLDVRKTPVDFIACGGHKWLNAPMGCGFLYVRKALVGSLRPPSYGYQSLREPHGGWGRYWRTPSITPDRTYRFPARARKWEVGGTANFPGAVALRTSVDLVNELGIEQVEAHIQSLVDRLLQGLDTIGAQIVSPVERRERAGIVSFRMYREPRRDWELVQNLLARKIVVSMRYTSRVGGIRGSVHYFNNEQDIDTLLDALRELR